MAGVGYPLTVHCKVLWITESMCHANLNPQIPGCESVPRLHAEPVPGGRREGDLFFALDVAIP
jgi:hypothetical protein